MHRKQQAVRDFPAGNIYEADYGKTILDLHFDSKNTLAYTIVKGPSKGLSERVAVSVVPVRPGVFMVSWQGKDKTSMVQLDDFENGITYAWVTRSDGKLTRMKGKLNRMELPVLCV